MKLAANLNMMFMEHKSLEERYGAAARAGFRFVETAVPYELAPEALAALLEAHKLTQVQINAPAGKAGEKGLACFPGREAEFRESIAEAIRYAKALQCPKVHVMAGLMPEDTLRLQAEQTFEANIRWAAKALGHEGITALIEPIAPAVIPGYFLNSFDQAIGYIQAVNEPSLRLQLDVFHAAAITGDALKTLKAQLPHTAHIQVAQSPERGDPGTKGNVDFAAIFKHLQSEGYDGFVGAEYKSDKDTPSTLGWVETFGLAL